ncbi:Probable lipoprotein precursor [Flavobacterium indicum GPTSA100-9 = DSM 17447]|uniref:Probable lipoprotein n=1 Tax=Flavobacterium indicum (strain DSM 17447 / CIP 109464 / GPTSA100-9) TaxID=1094466 RepID=H8XTG6_FLAIG|nr:DUF1573 domain-containing protein [Flavobacterium indicum]CCG52763.1 Probable lipoprotein precursor [Flavobacterium indicum GPTSA100-9 = DSM 17447]
MRKLATFLILSTFFMGCKKSNSEMTIDQDPQIIEKRQKELSEKSTTVSFDKMEHDFGEINQGEIVETEFIMKNTGNNDLYVIDAHGSCGCTVPEVTKEAIKPGESTPIKVKFDSNGKNGIVQKSINIRCNTDNLVEVVKIKANIKTNK